jgi:hypothetical protein
MHFFLFEKSLYGNQMRYDKNAEEKTKQAMKLQYVDSY